jgi:hypothetical protein
MPLITIFIENNNRNSLQKPHRGFWGKEWCAITFMCNLE